MSELKPLQDKVTERLQAIMSMRGGHSLTNGEGDKLWSTKSEVNLSSLARHAIHEVEKHYERTKPKDLVAEQYKAIGQVNIPKDLAGTPDTSAKVDVVHQYLQWELDYYYLADDELLSQRDLERITRAQAAMDALQAPRSDTSGVELLSGADLEMHIYAQYHNEYGHFPEEHGNTSKHDYSAFKRGYKLAMATKAEQWLKKVGE